MGPMFFFLVLRADAHLMERTPHEKDRDQKEDRGENMRYQRTILAKLAGFAANADREFHREQTEERRELNHRIQRN
jgi:hypothetical protein